MVYIPIFQIFGIQSPQYLSLNVLRLKEVTALAAVPVVRRQRGKSLIPFVRC